ncbi:MAG: hypothetical protein HY209_02995 [Candidatus Omnitrophica bacterium]|nr:hypothetical protein [Candidatus Omnitrophota bacterium]
MNHLPLTINRRRPRRGQSTIEFTFAVVMVALLIFGLIKIFQWVGMNFAQRSWDLDNAQFVKPPMDSSFVANEEAQLNHDAYRTKRLNAFTRNF